MKVGGKVPALRLPQSDGSEWRLGDHAGEKVVLYFYPKDNTPGCTVEACAFRDDSAKLKAAGAVVLGVSPDSEKSHQKFIEKFSLPFQLLVDTDNTLSTAYGAWGEKSMYGRSYMGVIRSTFLIGPDGKLAHVWPKVKVNGHSDEVLAAILAHASGTSVAAAPTKAKPAKTTRPKAAPKKAAAKAKKAAPKKR